MQRRLAYGLTIESEIPLPDLPEAPPGSRSVDVVIRYAQVETGAMQRLSGGLLWRVEGEDIVYEWLPYVRIRVMAGRNILVDVTGHEENARALRLMLLGPALNTVVRQRGMVMLHASGVEIGGRCCVFAGASGIGKSTLASVLEKMGHPVVADDGIVIDGGYVMPSWPSMKLWPESLHLLERSGEPLIQGALKQSVQAELFQTNPLPLGPIYLLAEGTRFLLEVVSGSRAALDLVAHASRAIPLENVDPAGHLAACAAIARSIPVIRLTRPRTIDLLDELVCLVLEDVVTR